MFLPALVTVSHKKRENKKGGLKSGRERENEKGKEKRGKSRMHASGADGSDAPQLIYLARGREKEK